MLFIDWCEVEENKERGERLKREWAGFDEHGNPVDIKKITHGSSKNKMLWECEECHHQWYTTMFERTYGSNCPYCSGHKVSELNSLSTWCFNNKEQGQIITSQWTGISKSGKQYTMDEVSYGSKLKMLWRCADGHEWYATILQRTGQNKTGCPHCNKRSTSYPEQYIYWALKQLYPETQNRCKVLKSPKYPYGIEYDIIVPDIHLAIEYSSTRWHRDKENIDNLKKETCNKHNIRLIQIIDDNYNEYKEKYTENYICTPMLTPSNRDDYLQKIVSYILNSIGHSINEIDIGLVKKNALDYSKKKIEYEKSLKFIHPELAKEMDNGMNNIKSDEILPKSNIRIKFLCPYCNYGADGSWEVAVVGRVQMRAGCGRCGYNWFRAQEGQPQKIKSTYKEWLKILQNLGVSK